MSTYNTLYKIDSFSCPLGFMDVSHSAPITNCRPSLGFAGMDSSFVRGIVYSDNYQVGIISGTICPIGDWSAIPRDPPL